VFENDAKGWDMRRIRSNRVATASGVLAISLASAVLATPVSAVDAPAAPTLRVFTTSSTADAWRYARGPTYVDLPVYVTTVGGELDLRAHREDYASPATLTQVIHGEGGNVEQQLMEFSAPRWVGIQGFFRVTVTDSDLNVVKSVTRAFCPNSYLQQRVDPDGADRQTYPDGCYGMPFTLGAVWGIDAGWATRALGNEGFKFRPAADGEYLVTVSVNPAYRTMFGIADADAVATTLVNVRTAEQIDGRPVQRAGDAQATAAEGVPVMADPDPSVLPDLRTLPAFGISVIHRHERDLLVFGANVWVDGASRLDVEGFRRSGEDVMDAYQYFYDGDTAVGRAPVGQMEFDRRDGHHHWHLLQFAAYRLLDSDQAHVVTSRKQSFCIVPTDPIDLSADNAERRPYQTGLDSACGAEDALWIRETLPVGWGDTYFQYRAGQSFNITDLPNGVYYIEVAANPTGELFESASDNNTSLRMVILEGKKGARKICVPAVNGIDAAGTCA
jgi:hypothetical protein